jgi:hypothetical protein
MEIPRLNMLRFTEKTLADAAETNAAPGNWVPMRAPRSSCQASRNPLSASSGNQVRCISKTTIPQHEAGIEPRLQIGFSEQRPRRSLAGGDGPCAIGERASRCRGSWFFMAAPLIGSAVRPHCVGKRSTEISQCSWARGPGAFLSPHWSYVATAQPASPAAPPHQQQRFGLADSSTPANVFLGAASRDHTAEVERELERVLTLGARGGVIFLGMMPFFSWRRCASAVYWCSCAHCEQKFYR